MIKNLPYLLEDKYEPILDLIETERAIKLIKDNFENELGKKLNLIRLSAPIFTLSNTGINDDLNGVEESVRFKISYLNEDVEIVQSLAKWKRLALARYNFKIHQGIYTDMNAIRKDEGFLDNIHSVYVDQWDWEKVILKEDRTLTYLKRTVKQIYSVIKKINNLVIKKYPNLTNYFPENIHFITSKKLLELYPALSPKEREREFAKNNGAIFVIGIGGKLRDGKPHDLRAPDYDDWSLNGDILLYYPPLNDVVELSSMGIRVDKKTLISQLKITNTYDERKNLFFHKSLLEDKLPLSIGGGIGQSRMCLVMLNKFHIGEVQSSIWGKEDSKTLLEHNVKLL